MATIVRKFMTHYFDTSFAYVPGETVPNRHSWYRIGEDLDEYNVDLNPTIAVAQNWLGYDVLIQENYEMSGEAKTFYARSGDGMFEALQDIIDNNKMNVDCFTLALDVKLWKYRSYSSGVEGYQAVMRPCYIVPVSYGGDTSGYQIPFNVYYLNHFITNGVFNPDGNGSGTFTKV